MQRNLQTLANETFDVLVIGGGIFGACSAWEASRRGLRVALIEKVDFGHATSANSLKTIHGGLRYLGRGQLRTMRRFEREQALYLRLAPHLVHPLQFILPFKSGSSPKRELISTGLNLHNRFSQGSPLPQPRWIDHNELQSIGSKGTGAITWHDAQVYETERLTLAFVATAAAAGAEVANHIEAQDFLHEDGMVIGARARDLLKDNIFDIRARIVVNAVGPWMGRLSIGALPRSSKFVKAINIIVPQVESEFAIGLPTKRQGRLFFVPWRGITMIGTSYAAQPSEPEGARATQQEIDDLLEAASEAIPERQFSRSDVGLVHCGLVPVTGSNGKSRRRASSKSIEQPGVISIIGSKYTMARGTAESIINRVFSEFGYQEGARAIDPLIGGRMDDIDSYVADAVSTRPAGAREDTIRKLVYSYGTEYRQILPETAATDESVLRGKVAHAIENEMAQTLSDVVFRRTGLGTTGHPGPAALKIAADEMASQMSWTAGKSAAQLSAVESEFVQI